MTNQPLTTQDLARLIQEYYVQTKRIEPDLLDFAEWLIDNDTNKNKERYK